MEVMLFSHLRSFVTLTMFVRILFKTRMKNKEIETLFVNLWQIKDTTDEVWCVVRLLKNSTLSDGEER